MLSDLYRASLSLLTDFYQLTMAYSYWKQGMQDHEAIFHLFFRKNPENNGFCIAAGLETALDYLEQFQFTQDDVEYLATLKGHDNQPLFETAFLAYLKTVRFTGNIDAIPEGTLVFPHEPLLRVQGSLLQCQLVESALLNIINFQTLIATKANRICRAAMGDQVLEFGLRRAQGIDGGLSASRAAYLGGCSATSNVLAGKLYDIPVKGTHAHSWVMSFDSEISALRAYSESMPNNCVFLVDTYDTYQGVANAIKIGLELKQQGRQLLGIRLDSGDLTVLSQYARNELNQAGLSQVKIIASNDLDEYEIAQLKQKRAAIDIWGVGTRLITSYDQPALGGVYKLAALRAPGQTWQYKLKRSEQAIKTSIPGILQVARYLDHHDFFAMDLIYEAGQENKLSLNSHLSLHSLLIPVMQAGEYCAEYPSLLQIQQRVSDQLAHLPESIRALSTPDIYRVQLDNELSLRQQQLMAQYNC
ncbi:nicotinate phosphoribosyltransferase [Thioflexithrix psekupsensis]|uniref:Nicotinate phosphoribosyltransferase n=1 Tax=Thioflexithrix psekupsensis TaxID=1570016 RepID=A0A251XC17_9GAMM|nr:nicotinate phosphoribosyltransferase [Thioflexithrix psekupsensis]OUD16062.1 nicotinate phosphoribosyltransferase [Thioflexithrix psekupsensis]